MKTPSPSPFHAWRTPAWILAAFVCLDPAVSPVSAGEKVLVPASLAKGLSGLPEKLPGLELVTYANRDEMSKKIRDCTGFVGSVTREMVQSAPKLKWVQVPSAGVSEYVTIPEMLERDILLTNLKIYQGPHIADHAMALLLCLTRNLKQYEQQMSSGTWQRDGQLPLIELHGKTMLIIGHGGIGTQVAERAFAFGMRVLTVDYKDIPMSRAVEYAGKPDELEELLPRADVVVSCVPHTPASEGMIGAKQFKLMKDGVYLINVSRGSVVDMDDLVAALRSGKVRAAGLDVTEPEPLPKNHPLWTMSNVMITPHVAGQSDNRPERFEWLVRDNLRRFVLGMPMKNVVEKKLGF